MKRDIALILCPLAFALALVTACGGESSQSAEEAAGASSAGEQAAGASSAEEQAVESEGIELKELGPLEKFTGDLDEMQRHRIIRILVALNRTLYFYDAGKPRGITYEGMVEFEKFLNRKLHPKDRTGKEKISVVFVPTSHQKMPVMLAEGYGDLAVANLTIDPERQKTFDFSIPSVDNIRQVIVTGPASPSMTSLDDLAGKEVYVKASATHYRNLKELSAVLEKKGKPAIRLVPADENLEDEDILEMVNAGLVSVTLMDEYVADFWAKVFDGLKVRKDMVVKSGNSKGWMFRKNSPHLKALVDEFIASHREGTAFGNILINRYLRSPKYVLNSVSRAEMEKFRRISGLIEKYSGKFDFDWLLIGAVAYQESGLDQSKRSPVGAVGIMQVMPSTAAGSPIFIKDIDNLENNIHAGVKLLRYIRDEHFNEPGLDPLNRTLLTIASYNAGPARIARCRQMAQRMGLDPDLWFGNVEFAVAKTVGRETVQYVANIYKYYLGYEIAVGRGEERINARKVISK